MVSCAMRRRRRRVLDVVQRAHVVQAVGELHQQDADVRRHRQNELAQVLGFLGALGLHLQAAELVTPSTIGRRSRRTGGRSPRACVGVLDRVVQSR